MILPLILIFFSTLAAAIATFGTLPQWATLSYGLHVIEMTRRLQWPLLTLSILLCVVLLVLIITGKRRVGWLVGLAPVGAMLLQLFVTGTMSNLRVVEYPKTLPADAANLKDEDYIVGVIFEGKPIALPYRQLFTCPVVIFSDRDKRMAVLWSAYANRALAFQINRQIKANELDIVSMPGNALLVYNGRLGEFINGVTGLTNDGKPPYGFGARLSAVTTTWANWQMIHPQTLVTDMPTVSTALPVPLRPQFPMRLAATQQADRRITFFATTQPVAIPEDRLSETPLNIELGSLPAVVFRDPRTGMLKAFERKVGEQTPRFIANPSSRRAAKGVFMLDVASNSGWTANGVAVDGDETIIGAKLTPIHNFDEHLYLGVMRNWYPDLVEHE